MSEKGLDEINRVIQEMNQMSDDDLGKLFDSVANEPPDPFYEFCSIVLIDDLTKLQDNTDIK